VEKRLSVAKDIVVENLGDDLLVMVPGHPDVVRLTGAAADTVRAVKAGEPVDAESEIVVELSERGIVRSSHPITRRGLVKAGAIGAGAGIAVLSMPSVAAAASGGLSLTGGGLEWNTLQVNTAGTLEDGTNLETGSYVQFQINDRSFTRQRKPGPLTITGPASFLATFASQPAQLLEFVANSGDGDYVFWVHVASRNASETYNFEFPNEPLNPPAPITGEFTWDGATYEVTFAPPQPL
jgi:hypothetical protein